MTERMLHELRIIGNGLIGVSKLNLLVTVMKFKYGVVK